MDKGILLATKTLVESIRHYIRHPSGVFSVCHAREWYILPLEHKIHIFSQPCNIHYIRRRREKLGTRRGEEGNAGEKNRLLQNQV